VGDDSGTAAENMPEYRSLFFKVMVAERPWKRLALYDLLGDNVKMAGQQSAYAHRETPNQMHQVQIPLTTLCASKVIMPLPCCFSDVSFAESDGPLDELVALDPLFATPFDTTGPEARFVNGFVLPRCQATGVVGFLL
jgi:hypothetical protein